MQPDFKAVDGIDFEIHCSEVLGLVGESGSGKVDHGPCHRRPAEGHRRFAQRARLEMNGVKERDFKAKARTSDSCSRTRDPRSTR